MPAHVLSRCSGSFAACRGKGGSASVGEAEVEPWGVSDAESWSERPQVDNASETQASAAAVQDSRRPDPAGSGAEVKCPDCGAHNESMLAMSQLLPGVGLLSAADSDVVRRHTAL